MRRRVERLRRQVVDERGGRVVLLSHCLLNQNVRYLGGATHPAMIDEVVDGLRRRDVGVVQMPCPEQAAWGGVLKPRLLAAYGGGGTVRGPVVRLLLRPFLRYTRIVYGRLARAATRDVLDYRRSGVEVVGLVGIGGSPSCGVRTTLDLGRAVDRLTRCPLAELDRRRLNEDVVAANVVAGEGMFTCALRRRFEGAGLTVPRDEYDLLGELGLAESSGAG